MVVGAVVDVLALVGVQGGVQVDRLGPRLIGQLVDDALLVGGGGPVGQAVGPDGGGGGNQAEVHRDGQVGGECVHIGQILFQLVHVRLIHPVDEGVVLAEIDPVVLLLAGQTLAPGLHGHPQVPAGDVIGDIALCIGHKCAAGHPLQRELGRFLQIAVLHGGEGLFRQEQTDQSHSADEAAKQGGEKNSKFFVHGGLL